MKTWAKVLIGVQTAFIIFLLTLNYFRASDAVKYRAKYDILQEEVVKITKQAEIQAQIASEHAARADRNTQAQAMRAEELSVELEKCKSKKQ